MILLYSELPLAIWDNRSVLHIPTRDQQGKRLGYRVITIGETPYLDPKSVSKLEALEAAAGIENDPKLEALKSVNLMGMHGTKEYRWSA